MIIKKSLLGLGLALVFSMLVVGCNSSSGDKSDLSGANNAAEALAAQDLFVEAVKAVIATTSDETEPVSIDANTPTSPDNTAPVPIS